MPGHNPSRRLPREKGVTQAPSYTSVRILDLLPRESHLGDGDNAAIAVALFTDGAHIYATHLLFA